MPAITGLLAPSPVAEGARAGVWGREGSNGCTGQHLGQLRLLTPHKHASILVLPGTSPHCDIHSLTRKILEDLGEKVRVCIELQHFGTHPVDDPERGLPENVLVRIVHEGLEGVGDLVAHVGVGEV
ncbi:hypothetical protein INR49_025202 [Caranx melampygus]|nr:hypothetical protein INR49_025202 [Caranx melampygus]